MCSELFFRQSKNYFSGSHKKIIFENPFEDSKKILQKKMVLSIGNDLTTRCWNNHLQVCMMFAISPTFSQEFSILSEVSVWSLTWNFLRVTRKWHSDAYALCLGHQVTKRIRIWAKNEKFCTVEARIFEYDRKFCCGWKLESSIYDPQMSLAFFGS